MYSTGMDIGRQVVRGSENQRQNQILFTTGVLAAARIPAGFNSVTAPESEPHKAAIQVVAAPQTTLQIDSDTSTDTHVYFWGLAGHPTRKRADVPRWIAAQVAAGDFLPLQQIVGSYIAIIDQRQTGTVRIVSDVGGTRPFFLGRIDDSWIGGSHVWTLVENRWFRPAVNYDAVAAWVRSGYDFTEGSLFNELKLIEPGAVVTLHNGQATTDSYIPLPGGSQKQTPEQFIETIYSIMSRSFQAATSEIPAVQIGLSGGFDSRFMAALARQYGIEVRAACLNDHSSEGVVARQVAERLGFALKMIETGGSRWDIYDDPFHFAPSGFPITKQQTYPAARLNPGMPCLNGFLGDVMVRGEVDRLDDKLPSETTEDFAKVYQRAQNMLHYIARFDLIDPPRLRRCDERTLPAARRVVELYKHTSNVFAAGMCLRRHRVYFGNNFVQHMAFAEPIVPFVNYELFRYKTQTDSDAFTLQNYAAMLARYFPKLADVPHNDTLPNTIKPGDKPSRAIPRWARAALLAIAMRNGLKILNRRKTIPRLMDAMRGGGRGEVVALFAYRLHLLEQRLRQAEIAFDWDHL